jgi:hypothetical protein
MRVLRKYSHYSYLIFALFTGLENPGLKLRNVMGKNIPGSRTFRMMNGPALRERGATVYSDHDLIQFLSGRGFKVQVFPPAGHMHPGYQRAER